MATVSFHPPGRGAEWTASSKSFASAPSIVTRGRSRRSSRSPARRIRDLAGDPFRFGDHLLRPDVGDPMGPDRDLRRHARPLGVAEALDDAPGRLVAPPIPGPGWRLDELDHHHLSVRPLPARNHHVAGKVPVVGRHEGEALRTEEAADDDPVVALEDLEHQPPVPGAEPAAAPPGEPELAHDPVAVHEAPHLTRGQEHVVAPVVAGKEPVPVSVGDHPPFDQATRVHGTPPGRAPRYPAPAAAGWNRPPRRYSEPPSRSPRPESRGPSPPMEPTWARADHRRQAGRCAQRPGQAHWAPAGARGGRKATNRDPNRLVEAVPDRRREEESWSGAQLLLVIRGALPYIAAPSAGRGGGTGRRASFRC